MYSFLLPTNIEIYQNPDFLKLEGPFGTLIKKTGGRNLKLLRLMKGVVCFRQLIIVRAYQNCFKLHVGFHLGFDIVLL